jgi:hypothetical protein
VVIDNHIANINADAQLYPSIGVDFSIPIVQSTLYFKPATYRVYGTVKLDQKPVAEGPNKAATVLGDSGFNQILYGICEFNVRTLFVGTHESAISDDIRKQHCDEPAFQGHAFHADHLISRRA